MPTAPSNSFDAVVKVAETPTKNADDIFETVTKNLERNPHGNLRRIDFPRPRNEVLDSRSDGCVGAALLVALIMIFLLLALGKVPSEMRLVRNVTCDNGWSYYNVTGKCYKVSRNETTFHEAHFYCQQAGGDLASLHSFQEDEFIRGLVAPTVNASSYVWFGLYDSNDTFVWTDGSAMPFAYTWPKLDLDEPKLLCHVLEYTDHPSPIRPCHFCRANLRSVYRFVCSKPFTLIDVHK